MSKNTLEAAEGEKLSAAVDPGKNWEYRCHTCGQLRLSVGPEEPEECGNCDSADITTGRPGELPNKPNNR